MKNPRRIVGLIASLLGILLLYLFLWPVPIDPVSWDAPVDAGLVDPFEANDRLRKSRLVELGEHAGPEDIAGGPDGLIYAGTSDGNIIRFSPAGSNIEVFANTGGRPLGLEFDATGNLVVANAYFGLQRISPDGSIELLTDQFGNDSIDYANDVAIAADDSIYFSDASSKFGARKAGGSYEASMMDLIEHGGHGRVLRFDPRSAETTLVVGELNFANGVAISEDQQYLLINETGSYRILRHWLAGADAGRTEVIVDNLPGFPDNINNGPDGRFWIGLVAPRVELLDSASDKPWLRKLMQRLPAAARPQAVPSTHVIAIDGDGNVLMNLQDTRAGLPALTGVYESSDALWFSTLFGNRTARLDKRDLASP